MNRIILILLLGTLIGCSRSAVVTLIFIRLLLRKWDWRKRSPSPRPSPPGEGEARTVPGIFTPLVWNCFMGTYVGGYAGWELQARRG